MKDPKEQDKKSQEQSFEDGKLQPRSTEDSNWEESQQVDEEGNELDPDDIK